MRMSRVNALPMLMIAAAGLVVGLAMPAAAREASTLINGKSIAKLSIPGNRLEFNTVTGKQIKESTLGTVPKATLAHKLTALKWHPLALENGWANLGVPAVRPAAYAVDAQGVVHLRGEIAGGTSGGFAFTVPASIRPKGFLVEVPVALHDVYVGIVEIETSGQGAIWDNPASPGYATTFTDLDGVTYTPTG
jgi:hypothetical protein